MDPSKFTFSHRKNNFAAHQPVLYTALELSQGPVAEFGCGYGSTPLLHAFCAARGRPVVTFESNTGWLEKIRDPYESDFHWFIPVTDWRDILQHPLSERPPGASYLWTRRRLRHAFGP